MVGLVIAMGDGRQAGARFASVTRRQLVYVDDVDDLLVELRRRPPGSYVTISGGSSPTSADLRAIIRITTELDQRIGFIAGWGPGQADHHAGKLATYPWMDDRSVLLWSHSGVGRLAEGTFGALEYLAADDQRLTDRLSVPRHVAAMITHANGVDGLVGEAVLCGVVTDKAPTPRRSFLPCGYESGPCVRSKNEHGQLRPPVRHNPRRIAADLVIWSACNGVLAADSLFDPARSLATDFVFSRWAGALLTTYKDIEDEVWPALLSLGMLGAGSDLGQICLELNRVTAAIVAGDTPWILLGDPEVAFPAQEPNLGVLHDGEHAVRMTPGVNVLQVPSADPWVITADPTDGGRVTGEELFIRQVPASRRVVAVHARNDPEDYAVRAEATEASVRFTAIRGIRSTLAPLAFALAVLDQLPHNPRSRGLLVQPELRGAIAALLDRHLALAKYPSDADLAGNLSGPEEDALHHLYEIDAWIRVNERLGEFLASYCATVGTFNSLVSVAVPAVALGQPRVRAALCPYCGMPVTRRDATVPLTGMTRRIDRCFRCALLSDTSGEVQGMNLDGPGTLRPRVRYEYALDFDATVAAGWRIVHASIRFEPVPWPVDVDGPMRSIAVRPTHRFPRTSLAVTLRDDLPPGVYYLVAAVAAHGDLWTCRRPVVVETA